MGINLQHHLDADHLAVLEMLPGDLLDLSDLPAARARFDELIAHMPAPSIPDSVEVADHHIEAADGHQMLVRVYRPKQRRDRSPGLYWIHGGGMILGYVGMDDAGCAAIASNLNVVVASVDYRLAPEFPYPTPLEDCYCGLTWFFDQADGFGLDTARIAVGGASAGGGLAAGLALLARDRKQVSPCFQLLTFPMIDDRNETPSSSMIDDNRLWNRDANIVGWSAYLDGNNGANDVSYYAAPARATDLGGLPPAIITVGSLDIFLDEDIAYAQAMLGAEVPCELHVYPGAFHGSSSFVPHSDISQRWHRDEMAALDRALNGP